MPTLRYLLNSRLSKIMLQKERNCVAASDVRIMPITALFLYLYTNFLLSFSVLQNSLSSSLYKIEEGIRVKKRQAAHAL